MSGTQFDGEKIIRYFNGSELSEDSSYITELFCDESKKAELRKLLSKQFYELKDEEFDSLNLDHILYKIHYEINTRKAKKTATFDNILKWSLRIAGVVILPLLVITFSQLISHNKMRKEAWVEIKAPAWTRAKFSLPDGTTGWLNSNSSVRYNGNFTSDRKVTLTGEAFFDVFKDKKRPFIVNTKDVFVKVLGTRFNIASYENEKNIEVVLEEGKLEINEKIMNQSVILKPNDMVVYNKSLRKFTSDIVQPQKYLSWTDGKLSFRNDPIDVIARRLERWYNVDVELNVPISEDLRLRATFVDESLEEVLSLLKKSLPLDYKIEDSGLDMSQTYTKKKVIITLRNQITN